MMTIKSNHITKVAFILYHFLTVPLSYFSSPPSSTLGSTVATISLLSATSQIVEFHILLSLETRPKAVNFCGINRDLLSDMLMMSTVCQVTVVSTVTGYCRRQMRLVLQGRRRYVYDRREVEDVCLRLQQRYAVLVGVSVQETVWDVRYLSTVAQ